MVSSSTECRVLDFFTCGVAQRQNAEVPKNAKQQDSFFVVEDLGKVFAAPLPFRCSLYGVIDGHGTLGEVAADFVSKHLPKQLATLLVCGLPPPEAICHAFTLTDHAAAVQNLPFFVSGCCVTLTLVTENVGQYNSTEMYTSWLGDCSAMLAGGGTHLHLTNEHKVSRVDEAQRIIKSGGFLTGDGRFSTMGAPGRLQVTRAIGDWWAKPKDQPVLLSLPEIRRDDLQVLPDGELDTHWQVLILATDGVWEFVPDHVMTEIILQGLQYLKSMDPADRGAHLSVIALKVVTEALRRGSDDNASALIINLHRVHRSQDTDRINRIENINEIVPQPFRSNTIPSCPWCDLEFDSFKVWKKHMRQLHVQSIDGYVDFEPCPACWRPLSDTHTGLPNFTDHIRLCPERYNSIDRNTPSTQSRSTDSFNKINNNMNHHRTISTNSNPLLLPKHYRSEITT